MRISTPFRRAALAGVLIASMSAGVTSVASADNDNGNNAIEVPQAPKDKISERKDKCLAGIDKRVADLAAWSVKLDGLAKVPAATKTTLKAQLTTVSTGLTTVAKPAVVAATTPEAIKIACTAVVENYRVYRVVHPQVFLTAGANAVLTSVDDLKARLATATNGAGNADVTALLDKATATANDVLAKVAPITPASYNAAPDATQAVFKAARESLKGARSDLKAAGKKIKELNKANKPGKKKKKGGDHDDDDDSTSSTSSSTSSTSSSTTSSSSTTVRP
jgi:hypothetical protein